MIQLEIEWRVTNLQATAAQFLTTVHARHLQTYDQVLETPEDAAEFLLHKLGQLLRYLPSKLGSSGVYADSFEIYKSVWVFTKLTESNYYAGSDRLLLGAGPVVRQHDALAMLDSGILANRTLELAASESRVLLAEVLFLTVLGSSGSQH